MSRQASAYLAQHLYEIRRATYLEGDKVRPLGETGLALLVYLCDATNKNGTFFMTAETMKDEVGIATIRQVRRLLAGLEQIGWITRTGELISYEGRGKATPEYALTLVPGLWIQDRKQRSGVPQGTEQVSHGTPENTLRTNNEKGSVVFSFSEPEPQPHPEPHPEPLRLQVSTEAEGGGKEWGERHEQVLAGCLAKEDYRNDKGGLRKHKTEQYRPVIIDAIRAYPGRNNDTLVSMCMTSVRTGEPLKAPKAPDRMQCADAIESAYRDGKRGQELRQAIALYSPDAQDEVWGWFCDKHPDAPTPGDTHKKSDTRASA